MRARNLAGILGLAVQARFESYSIGENGDTIVHRTPAPGRDGETRPWQVRHLARSADGTWSILYPIYEWWFWYPSCFVTSCDFEISWETYGARSAYAVEVLRSDGQSVFEVIIVAAPLDVTITGPSDLYPFEQGTYRASASGGGTPYSHRWFRRDKWQTEYRWLADGPFVTAYSGACDGDFWLKVRTTSANGMTDEAVKFVDVLAQTVDGNECLAGPD